ncbi:ribonuclease H1-like [Lycorma delicatula]|uniref:ribonuclease H1-like n=1 Tax=Lycorma delicatula TaxID=130591 RepID=UPI003F5141AB
MSIFLQYIYSWIIISSPLFVKIKCDLGHFPTEIYYSKGLEKTANQTEPQVLNETVAPFLKSYEYVHVYADGCVRFLGMLGLKAGIAAWFNDKHPLNTFQPAEPPPTFTNAEVQAIQLAADLALANGVKNIIIHTDSGFAINAVTKFYPIWLRRRWRNREGKIVQNRARIIKLKETLEKFIKLRWVYLKRKKKYLEIGHKKVEELSFRGLQKYNEDQVWTTEDYTSLLEEYY